jgi:hypothetical protein
MSASEQISDACSSRSRLSRFVNGRNYIASVYRTYGLSEIEHFLWDQKSNSDRNFHIIETIRANAERGRQNFVLPE